MLESLQELVYEASSNLTLDQLREETELLLQYEDVFVSTDTNLGYTNFVQHRINTADSAVTKQSYRRLPFAKQEEAENIIQDMKGQRFIESKKNGSLRLCLDYNKLNNITFWLHLVLDTGY